jgi:hypothetical protein
MGNETKSGLTVPERFVGEEVVPRVVALSQRLGVVEVKLDEVAQQTREHLSNSAEINAAEFAKLHDRIDLLEDGDEDDEDCDCCDIVDEIDRNATRARIVLDYALAVSAVGATLGVASSAWWLR